MPNPSSPLTLLSTRDNLNPGHAVISSRDVAPRCPTPWTVTYSTLHGGRQEGVQLITIDILDTHAGLIGKSEPAAEPAPAARIRLIPTRGLNILDAAISSLRLGWDSPVREVVHPSFINLAGRGGLGWLEGFNEFIARCGLEWFGAPCTDTHHHAQAEPPAGALSLHGRISNIPASHVELTALNEPPYTLTLRGLVREQGLFTPNLDLETELAIDPADPAGFTITDRITNRSGQPQEFGLLYHVNQGTPLLGPDASFIAPVKRVMPRDARAAEGGMARWNRYEAPQPGYAEQVYLMELLAGDDRGTTVMLRNPAGDAALSMTYNVNELPYFTLWKNTAAEADGYVTGLEPGTGYPYPRPIERKFGRVPILQPGQSHTASVTYRVLADSNAVLDAERHIAGLQGGVKPVVEERPPDLG